MEELRLLACIGMNIHPIQDPQYKSLQTYMDWGYMGGGKLDSIMNKT